jgi:hypothetical protein
VNPFGISEKPSNIPEQGFPRNQNRFATIER